MAVSPSSKCENKSVLTRFCTLNIGKYSAQFRKMTIDIDENSLSAMLDGMKKMSESKASSGNAYGRTYSDYIKAYSNIGLYVTFVDGHHVVVKSSEM